MRKELAETMIDIALNAGYMIAQNEIAVSDSRELISNIQVWAEEFVREGLDGSRIDDYIGAVDEFAARMLLSTYS